MEININELTTYINNFIYPFCRIIGFFLFAPLFNFTNIYHKIKLGIAIIITFALVPILNLNANYSTGIKLFSNYSLILMVLEFIIGLSLGFLMNMFFQIFIFGGRLTASGAYLNFAEVNDANSNESTPLLGQFYLIMIYLIYLSLDGHLLLINILQSSFNEINLSSLFISKDIFWKIISFGYYIFAGGLLLAIPAVCALLIVNIIFGIITKIAPQLNIFAVGFPLILIIGLFVLLITLSGVSDFFINFSNDMLSIINSIFI